MKNSPTVGHRRAASKRGRQPRLAVIDAATVDGRRHLILIRRDNVEHLLMVEGPSDIVVEPNIMREMQREPAPVRPPTFAEAAHRPVLDEGMSPLQLEPPVAPALPPPQRRLVEERVFQEAGAQPLLASTPR